MSAKFLFIGLLLGLFSFSSAQGQDNDLNLSRSKNEKPLIKEYPTLTLEDLLKINELENKLDGVVRLLPNPSTGKFVIVFLSNKPQSVDVTIHNTQGQLIYKNKLYTKTRTNQLVVEDAKLKRGVYLLRLSLDDMEINRKLIMY